MEAVVEFTVVQQKHPTLIIYWIINLFTLSQNAFIVVVGPAAVHNADAQSFLKKDNLFNSLEGKNVILEL